MDNNMYEIEAYIGTPLHLIPIILRQGRVPLDIPGLMRMRLSEYSESVKVSNQRVVTSTPYFLFDNGDFVIASYQKNPFARSLVDSIKPGENMVHRELYPLSSQDQSRILEGNHLIIDASKRGRGMNDDVWSFLADGDLDLKNSYVDRAKSVIMRPLLNPDNGLGLGIPTPVAPGIGLLFMNQMEFGSEVRGIQDIIDFEGPMIGVKAGSLREEPIISRYG